MSTITLTTTGGTDIQAHELYRRPPPPMSYHFGFIGEYEVWVDIESGSPVYYAQYNRCLHCKHGSSCCIELISDPVISG